MVVPFEHQGFGRGSYCILLNYFIKSYSQDPLCDEGKAPLSYTAFFSPLSLRIRAAERLRKTSHFFTEAVRELEPMSVSLLMVKRREGGEQQVC